MVTYSIESLRGSMMMRRLPGSTLARGALGREAMADLDELKELRQRHNTSERTRTLHRGACDAADAQIDDDRFGRGVLRDDGPRLRARAGEHGLL